MHSRVGLRIPAPRQTVTVPRRTTLDLEGRDLVLEGTVELRFTLPTTRSTARTRARRCGCWPACSPRRPFPTELRGDASLHARPMERVADPLRAMGADVRTTDGHAADRGPRRPAPRDRAPDAQSRALRSRAPSCSPVSPRRVRPRSASRPRPATTPSERWRRSAPRSRSSPGWRPSARSSTRGSRRRCPATSRRPRSWSARPSSPARPWRSRVWG